MTKAKQEELRSRVAKLRMEISNLRAQSLDCLEKVIYLERFLIDNEKTTKRKRSQAKG